MTTIDHPVPSTQRAQPKRLLVAVVARKDDNRRALSSAFAPHPTQRVICSATPDNASALLEHRRADAIVGFVEDFEDWQRFKALAAAHPDAISVLLVSDPESIDTRTTSAALDAIASAGRSDLTSHAASLTSSLVAQHRVNGTHVEEADALDQAHLESLTKREREILELTARGLAIKEIAQRINRSYATVATHRIKIMEKLGLHDKVALTRFAIRTGLIPA